MTPDELSELRVSVAAAKAIAMDAKASAVTAMFPVHAVESLCDSVFKLSEVVATLVEEAAKVDRKILLSSGYEP